MRPRWAKRQWLPVISGWLLLLQAPCHASAMGEPEPGAQTSPPFFNLRQSILDYHGPSFDFTNLTELRIGWYGPTNLDDPLTGDLWWAANLAVEEANAAASPRFPLHVSHFPFPVSRSTFPDSRLTDHPLVLPFRLIPRWSVNPWGTGVSQLVRMVYDEEPLALIGSVDSASTHLAEQVVAKANLPLVSPIATDQSVTLAGVSWMFSCAPTDDVIARVLVDGVLAELGGAAGGAGMQSAALFSSTDHQSRMTAGEVLREFSHHGRLPDFRYEVSPGTADITRQLQAVAGAGPRVVIIIADAADSARLLRSVRTMISEAAVFGGPAMGRSRFLELAGPAAEGVRFPVLSGPDPGDRDYALIADRFWAERGRTPDYAAVLVYDATRLLLEAVRRAGPNRVRIREALLELSPWPGLAGPIQFDGTGQNTRANLRLGTIRNGMVVTGTS